MYSIKELKERYKGEYADVDVYRYASYVAQKDHSFHSDDIKDVYDDVPEDVEIVADYRLMDEEDYNNSVFANTCMYFSDIYSPDDKVLVIMVPYNYKDLLKKHWFIIDETKGDIFEDDLGDISRDTAAIKLLDAWGRLTPHDREQRRAFFAAFSRLDEDGCIDYGNIDDTIELNVEPRSVSLDNGAHYDSDVDYLMQEIEENHLWDALVNVMDDDTRELVHEAVAPCSDKEFLRAYLLLAPSDLVIG